MAVPAPPTSPPGPERSRALRQAVTRGSALVLAAAVAMIAFGAWPLFEVAIEGPRALAARRGLERALRARGWAAGPPEVTELPASPLRGLVGRTPPGAGRGEGAPEIFDRLFDEQSLEGRSVRARGRVALLENADPTASAEVTVDERMPLHVVTDLGSWLLLAVRLGDEMHLGWAPRESIVTLP